MGDPFVIVFTFLRELREKGADPAFYSLLITVVAVAGFAAIAFIK